MKKRTSKQRIPAGAFDGILSDIRRVRLEATPEGHRELQKREHELRTRCEANETPQRNGL